MVGKGSYDRALPHFMVYTKIELQSFERTAHPVIHSSCSLVFTNLDKYCAAHLCYVALH